MSNSIFMREIRALVKRHGSFGRASSATSINKKTLYAWSRGWRRPRPTEVDAVTMKTGIPKERVRPDVFKP